MAVELPINSFKTRLSSGPCQIGFWSTLCSPIATEIVANSGFDWVILDTEHGPADPLTSLVHLQSFGQSDTAPCIRIAANDPVLMKKALDIGAQTILVPQIETADDARRAIASATFPPSGVRGVSTTARATRYGSVSGYHRQAEAQICIILMIESAAALSALPHILEVPGADVFLFGPQDLAANMGFLSQPNADSVVRAMEAGAAAITSKGKYPGVAVGNETDAKSWIERGARFVTCGSDVSLLARGAEGLARRMVAEAIAS